MSNPADSENIPRQRNRDKSYSCSVNECFSPARHRGLCTLHYQRWQKYGDPTGGGLPQRPRGLNVPEQIEWELSHSIASGECLISHRAAGDTGYAKTRIGQSTQRIHRAVLQHHVGRLLTSDEEACHTCHNKMCINPQHLYVGSRADNMGDMVNAGRANSGQGSGASNSNAKFTHQQIDQIRRRHSEGVKQIVLAEEYKCHPATISRIVKGVSC